MSAFIRQMAPGRFLSRVALVVAIGGFLFGHDTEVTGGALLFIKKSLHAAIACLMRLLLQTGCKLQTKQGSAPFTQLMRINSSLRPVL